MLQIVYISSVPSGVGAPDLAAILDVSRRNNRRDGISGLLLHDGVRFLQALEGDREQVEAAYLRIKADPRHRAPVVLKRKTPAAREFGEWAMACESVDRRSADSTIADCVDRLVAVVPDPGTRALFEGFARIDRRPNAA